MLKRFACFALFAMSLCGAVWSTETLAAAAASAAPQHSENLYEIDDFSFDIESW